MTPEEIIEYCQANNIALEPTDRGTIIVDVPDKSLWSEGLSEAVKAHKPELIRILQVKSTFEDPPSITCENSKCSQCSHCVYIHNLDKCPWLLDEGIYKWKGEEWKKVLH